MNLSILLNSKACLPYSSRAFILTVFTMSTTNYSIPSDLWVLVTGANGFIATHVIEAFLAQGYKVRGTVRSEKPWVDEYFKGKYGPANFETVIVPKLEEDGALDGCLADVGGVVHVVRDCIH